MTTDGSTTSDVQTRYARYLPTRNSPSGDWPGEEIGDRLVLDLIGDERGAIEHAEHGHGKAEVERPDHQTEDTGPTQGKRSAR